ncbi:16S rRNA (cytosine1402-N4)-methyltransferase [Saccharopolyspora erythraea NRRL 2338]|uniref:Ribosomal RNA small subunit methyltransferase H n=2 Tax=Saccharopolyspora erythraea TaxID=1836 RepID=RSMH_SACEN|nr:16S rRNA (cytosine(1402)-N(4))-methyltransferase RsmH [Saccharopolyspora erythraea]A4FLX5.1 RecName: Full=Ribosomal RNA small subunit methyltransferase H; AltName: Full=16S rRNA m(4)C1402 methyltransferase; AltName: Full=rRNA (cytosine-N(4)-)-methyltransferase RsmH [Saccharopolyspora erythraea NRRL 2338]EQD88195.1 16S rRNA methyltransferase [Saccharopolyspora erythraea D]PFG98688.1 16S rRNA (cytosine1402-N4)-methyltransferase [Saccharopolyspora erythraea NRRL 2338]QRK88705.1 16S rRNA (cytosi
MADEQQRRAQDGGSARDRHVPVMMERTLELLAPALSKGPAVVVDATLGMGGHSEALLAAHPELTLVGLDRDPDALRLAGERLAPHSDRVHLVHAVYDEWAEALAGLSLSKVDGALFDLGVSSLQLDETDRGFAYAHDAPLDMRMDSGAPRTAADVLNTYSAGELTRVLREYGEEKFAARIAAAIVRERAKAPFDRSGRLVELLYDAVPAASRRTGGHPAKRTFQALRIEVNAELEVLGRALPAALDSLAVGGRMVVMSYHSLEDRMVKRAFAERAKSKTPVDLPVELPGHGPEIRLLTRGAELASDAETAANPRAASVRLRAAERIKEAV